MYYMYNTINHKTQNCHNVIFNVFKYNDNCFNSSVTEIWNLISDMSIYPLKCHENEFKRFISGCITLLGAINVRNGLIILWNMFALG